MTTSSLGTLSTDMVFTIDAVNELMEFIYDPSVRRGSGFGVRSASSWAAGWEALRARRVSLMTQVFWDAWEDRLGVYERRPPRHPR